MLDRDPTKGTRKNVLLLGISYPCVTSQMKERGFPQDILTHKTPSVEQAVECVCRNILTEMDARDLARCIATEQATDTDVYTVSKEVGAIYRSDRHVHANFNARNFCNTLQKQFGKDIQFSQIILDYYWMPTGWLVTRWAKTLFQQTLPDLVRKQMITYPSRRKSLSRRGVAQDSSFEEGVVYLPFCAHVCKELVGAISILEKYYSISFVLKQDLSGHSLWKGTMAIDAQVMQTRLGKRLDQEEVYCTFRPKDIYESMEDAHVSKPAVMKVLLAIENYDDIRMIKLRPLRQHEKASVFRERLYHDEIGGFQGLNYDLAKVKLNEMKRGRKKAASPAIEDGNDDNNDDGNKGKKPQREDKPIDKASPSSSTRTKSPTPKKSPLKTATPPKARQNVPAKQTQSRQPESKLLKRRARKVSPNIEESQTTQEKVETATKASSAVYYNVEEPDLEMLRRFKFFPGPVRDLDTYSDAEGVAAKDEQESHIWERKARKARLEIAKNFKATSNASTTMKPSATLLATPPRPRKGVIHEHEPAQEISFPRPKEYLAFNPRNPPIQKRSKTNALLNTAKVVHPSWTKPETFIELDWSVIEEDVEDDSDDQNHDDDRTKVGLPPVYEELEAASTLYFCLLKNIDSTTKDIQHVARLRNDHRFSDGMPVQRRETACFVLDSEQKQFDHIGGYKLESAESLQKTMGDVEIPISAVVLACRGPTEHLLDVDDGFWLGTAKRSLISYDNHTKPGKVYHKKATIDRVQNLNTIVRWLLSGRQEKYDRSGCLRLLEIDLKTNPQLCIGKLALELERALNEEIKAATNPDTARESSSELQMATEWYMDLPETEVDEFESMHAVGMSLRDLETKRSKLVKEALAWLKHKTDANDPTGEFLQIEGKMPENPCQTLEERAEELASRIESVRNVIYFFESAGEGQHSCTPEQSSLRAALTQPRKPQTKTELSFLESLALIPLRVSEEKATMKNEAESLVKMKQSKVPESAGKKRIFAKRPKSARRQRMQVTVSPLELSKCESSAGKLQEKDEKPLSDSPPTSTDATDETPSQLLPVVRKQLQFSTSPVSPARNKKRTRSDPEEMSQSRVKVETNRSEDLAASDSVEVQEVKDEDKSKEKGDSDSKDPPTCEKESPKQQHTPGAADNNVGSASNDDIGETTNPGALDGPQESMETVEITKSVHPSSDTSSESLHPPCPDNDDNVNGIKETLSSIKKKRTASPAEFPCLKKKKSRAKPPASLPDSRATGMQDSNGSKTSTGWRGDRNEDMAKLSRRQIHSGNGGDSLGFLPTLAADSRNGGTHSPPRNSDVYDSLGFVQPSPLRSSPAPSALSSQRRMRLDTSLDILGRLPTPSSVARNNRQAMADSAARDTLLEAEWTLSQYQDSLNRYVMAYGRDRAQSFNSIFQWLVSRGGVATMTEEESGAYRMLQQFVQLENGASLLDQARLMEECAHLIQQEGIPLSFIGAQNISSGLGLNHDTLIQNCLMSGISNQAWGQGTMSVNNSQQFGSLPEAMIRGEREVFSFLPCTVTPEEEQSPVTSPLVSNQNHYNQSRYIHSYQSPMSNHATMSNNNNNINSSNSNNAIANFLIDPVPTRFRMNQSTASTNPPPLVTVDPRVANLRRSGSYVP